MTYRLSTPDFSEGCDISKEEYEWLKDFCERHDYVISVYEYEYSEPTEGKTQTVLDKLLKETYQHQLGRLLRGDTPLLGYFTKD